MVASLALRSKPVLMRLEPGHALLHKAIRDTLKVSSTGVTRGKFIGGKHMRVNLALKLLPACIPVVLKLPCFL